MVATPRGTICGVGTGGPGDWGDCGSPTNRGRGSPRVGACTPHGLYVGRAKPLPQSARPRLTWSRVLTGRKFGHYDSIHDTVMVSDSLDNQEVPEYVVDYVVYRELLHKKHGARWSNGRRYVHTPEFNREERLFRRYTEAEAVLSKLARV